MQSAMFQTIEAKNMSDENIMEPIMIEPQIQTDKYGFMTKPVVKKDDKKKQNARIEKWRQMLQNWEKQDSELIKERVRKGVPNGMRNMVWPVLANIKDMKADAVVTLNKAQYSDFTSDDKYPYEHQIKLDVNRTFPNNVNFQHQTAHTESLICVLKALSAACPKLGYCQGMNFLTASLLMITSDENAFWILYSIMTKHNQADKYINPVMLNREFYVLDHLMAKYIPEVHKVCKHNQIDLFYFATEWFITLFSSILRMDLFYRVFEQYLIEGEKTLFRCALTIISIKKAEILHTNSFEQQVKILKNTDDLQNYDEDKFMKILQTQFTFSKSLIQQLSDDYETKQK